MEVTHIQQVVEYRKCPGCGYVMHQYLIARARLNFQCKCEEYTLADFLPFDPSQPKTPTPPRKRRRLVA